MFTSQVGGGEYKQNLLLMCRHQNCATITYLQAEVHGSYANIYFSTSSISGIETT